MKPKSHVITAYAESAAGPGWANSPIWVILQDPDGKIWRDCIQPHEQTAEMHLLYPFSQTAHLTMVRAVERKRRVR